MVSIDRKVGQRVYLGNDCIVTVLAIDAHSVRLNFIAPKDIKIAREELLNKAPSTRTTSEVSGLKR